MAAGNALRASRRFAGYNRNWPQYEITAEFPDSAHDL